MVGGQLLLITTRWGGAVRTAYADPTGLDILTEVVLGPPGATSRSWALRVLRYLGRGSATSPTGRIVLLVGGDFNSIWEDHHGPLRGLGVWAAQSSLISPVAAMAASVPLCSYLHWRGSQEPH